MNLLEATRKVDFTGFIVSIENEKLLKDASALGLTNTLIKSSVPQKELLAFPKVKLILTHCEGPQVAEALYNGAAVLGFPMDGGFGHSQRGTCKKLQDMGVGFYGDISAEPNKIAAQISKMTATVHER